MKRNLLLLFTVIMLSACYSTKECVCPEYYSPVCGENGETYMNPCGAECDEVDYIKGECPVYGIGQVQYSGDSLCGYYVAVFGTFYKPRQLPEEFRVDDLTVTLRYRKMDAWYSCEADNSSYQEIIILEISKIL